LRGLTRKPVPPGRITGLSIIFCGVYLVLVAAACSGKDGIVRPLSTPTPLISPQEAAAITAAEQDSWVFVNEDFANASQLEKGAEVYRLVCNACHGDVGQGLTQDWLEKWDPEDRNCWQSKCHGKIRPPDGFELPRFVPPVKGPKILAMFDTALDLYQYNKATMPWHAPGTMRDEEYWQVTAFMVEMNGVDLGGTILGETTAAQVSLKP
jgi:hypothetical protein